MARAITLSTEVVAGTLRAAGPAGLTPEALAQAFPGVSRSTLNRRLSELVISGAIKPQGQGRASRYVAAAAYGVVDIRRYFETDWQARPTVSYQEALLGPEPGLDADQADRLTHIQALRRPLDKRFLADFLIDFSWASSVLEGSTYTSLDTQALVEYGARNPDKPVEDAVLILDHKNAIQHLWAHRELSVENLCRLQAFLTDGHELPEVAESDHFLPAAKRGVPREYEDVRLGRSAYLPPFRPGTGYLAKALAEIVATAGTLPPVAAAFYLISRLPYLQGFANGNKRTARLAATIPLLQADLLPISFVDFRKSDYVLGMAAFYELGDTQVLQQVFVEGYVRSIVRSSEIPASLRLGGLQVESLAQELLGYVRGGRLPAGAGKAFLR